MEKRSGHSHKREEKEKKKEVGINKDEFDKLNEKARKAEDYYDRWLRLQAELENTKKRLEREKEDFLKFANEGLILRLLPTIDNFDRALNSVRHTKETDAVLEGVRMVQKELHAVLRDYRVETVKSIGEKFDPHLHEAIAVVETDECPEDTVVEEIQTGYTLNGRLIRPAIVKVSRKRQ